MKTEQKQKLIESISSKLSAVGIPVADLKLKKVEDVVKIIPIGFLDLEKFKESYTEINTSLFHHVELSGVNRNTEYIVTYNSIKDDDHDSDIALEEFRKIEKQIDECVEKALSDAIEEIFKKTFDSFGERVPEKIRKNYEMSNDFSSVRNWKAKVYLANSCNKEDPQEGDMGEVGYTMIEVDTGEIIPIARSDEHRMGYDLIHHLISKKLIPKGNYFPIFFSNNYVYGEYPDQVRMALKAFKIWRDNGGENTSVTNTGNSGDSRFIVKMDDFIAANGKIKVATGELFPMGKRIVKYLEKCATVVKNYHEGKKVNEDNLAGYAELLVRELLESHKFFSEVKELDAAVKSFKENPNFKKLEEAIFSHNGFKNEIHMQIRAVLKDPSSWKARDIEEVFGDAEFANREFNRLALI